MFEKDSNNGFSVDAEHSEIALPLYIEEEEDDLLDSEPLILVTESEDDSLQFPKKNLDQQELYRKCCTIEQEMEKQKYYCSSCSKKIQNCELCCDEFIGKTLPSPNAYRNLYEILEMLEITTSMTDCCGKSDNLEENISDLKNRMKREIENVISTVEKKGIENLREQEEKLKSEYEWKQQQLMEEYEMKNRQLQERVDSFNRQKIEREKIEFSNKPIHLNVGGTLVTVSLSTFVYNDREPTNLFKQMLGGEYPMYRTQFTQMFESAIFIDCELNIFNLIMDWLRFGLVNDQLDYYTFKKLWHCCRVFKLNNLEKKLQSVTFVQKFSKQGVPEYQNKLGEMYRDGIGIEKDYKMALHWFRMAANQEYAKAQFNLALMFHNGCGTLQESALWYEKAASNGDINAQNNLGVLIRDNQKDFHSYEKSIEWLEKASNQGHILAMCNLALMYIDGMGVSRSLEKARQLFKKAALLGNPTAQNNLANMYENGDGGSVSLEKAIHYYKEAAKQGHALAQYNLGLIYEKGLVEEQSFEQAFKWYEKSAIQGNEHAQNNLGYLYETGKGIEKSYEKAIEWYAKSAQQGNPQAQYNLAVLYEDQGDELSCKKSIEWFVKSANQGDADAQCHLGLIYLKETCRDYQKAFNWFQNAAESNAIAQNWLGLMYEYGLGTDENKQKALEYYEKASSNIVVSNRRSNVTNLKRVLN